MNDSVHFSSKDIEWETPKALFDELNKEFHFEMDVCSTHENAKCVKHYTKEDDGLFSPWEKVNWMNPPYGLEIKKWIAKASRNPLTVCLVPARTDTVWFHEYIYNKTNVEIRFLKGRLKFGGNQNGSGSAPFPSMIVIFR